MRSTNSARPTAGRDAPRVEHREFQINWQRTGGSSLGNYSDPIKSIAVDGVPPDDGWFFNMVVSVTENAERRCTEKEMLRLPYLQPDPTRGQDTSEVAMREDGNITLQRSKPGNQPIRAFGNLSG